MTSNMSVEWQLLYCNCIYQSDIYKQVNWSQVLHFNVLKARVMSKKKHLKDLIVMVRIFSKHCVLWDSHSSGKYLLSLIQERKKSPTRQSRFIHARSEQRLSHHMWTIERAIVAQIVFYEKSSDTAFQT